MDLGSVVILLFLALMLWGIPIIFVLSDPCIEMMEKVLWVFAIWLASWLGWLLYQYAAPILPRKKLYDSDDTRDQISPTL